MPGTATQHTFDMQPSQKGWVAISGRGVSGGRLIIDDKFACATPCRTEVTPGKHEIVVEKNGMEDYESDLDVPRGIETTDRGADVAAPAAHARDLDRGRRGAADRRRRVRRAPVAGRTTTRSTPTSSNGILIDNNDPRFLRGKIEAIGADVLYGVGAIVAMTAVFGLFSHGPDSTGVADHKKVSLTPTMGRTAAAFRCGGAF